MSMVWAIMMCENCTYTFAVPEEPDCQSCPSCGSEDTTGTGEYLADKLYTKSGKEIQPSKFPVKEKQKDDKYEIFTKSVIGYTSKQYSVGDIIPSMGFGSLDKKIWKVDAENKRYYVDELID